ncbi:MAG: YdbH domain-containing protein, partial [Thermodesulfobacteriota bacterium]
GLLPAASPGTATPAGLPVAGLLPLGELQVAGGRLLLELPGRTLELPFELCLRSRPAPETGGSAWRVEVLAAGMPVAADLRLTPDRQQLLADRLTGRLDLAVLGRLGRLPAALGLAGHADLDGHGQLPLANPRAATLDGQLLVNGLTVEHQGASVLLPHWRLQLAGGTDPAGAWQLTASAGPPSRCQLALAHRTLAGSVGSLQAALGAGEQGGSRLQLSLRDLGLQGQDLTAGLGAVSLTGHSSGQGLELALSIDEGLLQAGGRRLRLGAADLAVGAAPGAENWRGQARLHLADIALEAYASQVALAAADLALPFQWPPPAAGSSGELRLQGLQLGPRPWGDLAATLRQEGTGLTVAGRFRPDPLPELAVDLAGQLGWSAAGGLAAGLHWQLPATPLPADLDLGRLAPAAQGVFLAGVLEGRGRLTLEPAGPRGQAALGLRNGSVRWPAQDLLVEGLGLELALAEIIPLTGRPGSRLRFERLTAGRIALLEGAADFTLESAASLLVERASASWCGGRLSLTAARLGRDAGAAELELAADRLRITDLATQLQLGTAEGDGTLSGRLPIHWSRDQLALGHGFFASTPGTGGRLRLPSDRLLAAGLSTDRPELGGIALAAEALRDYDYQWLRLELEPQAEDLRLRLQLDGRPAGPLPFVFQEETGAFVQVDPASHPGSLFQGIRLDLRFTLPLDPLVRYGRGLGRLLR